MGILQLVLVVLGMLYLVVAVCSLLRLFKVAMSQSAIKISISFYSGMLIASIARAISLCLIGGNILAEDKIDIFTKMIAYLLIVIPDMLNVCVYLFLIWYFYANFILSHINIANDLRLFMKDDIPKISDKTYTMLYVILPAYLVTFSIICILTLCDKLEDETLFIINSYFDLITPVLFIAYYFFLLLKFSGRPYINDNLKMQVRRIFIIVLIWSVSRMVTGVIGIISIKSLINSLIAEYKQKMNDILYTTLIICYFVISEFVPDYFALDHDFMMTYIQAENQVEEVIVRYF
jgi:hypothetical protein